MTNPKAPEQLALEATLKPYGDELSFISLHNAPFRIDPAGEDRWNLVLKDPRLDMENGEAVIAAMRRIGEKRWRMEAAEGHARTFPAKDLPPSALEFEADNLNDAAEKVRARVRAINLPQNKLEPHVFADMLNRQLQAANILACRSGALAGYVKSIAAALAALITQDVQEGKEVEFLSAFLRVVSEYGKEMAQTDAVYEAAQSAIQNVLSKSLRDFVEDPPEPPGTDKIEPRH
jgi:hypothetical protein